MLLKLAVALLIPACALAQVSLKPYNLTAAVMFTLSDANKDGILTISEIDNNFKGCDTIIVRKLGDGDCSITNDRSGLCSHDRINSIVTAEARPISYDTDNNGRISRFEYTSYVDQNSPQLHAFSHALYDIYDVDSDDVLDLHDYENFHRLLDGNGDGVVVQHEYVRYFEIVLEELEHLHGGGKRSGLKNKL